MLIWVRGNMEMITDENCSYLESVSFVFIVLRQRMWDSGSWNIGEDTQAFFDSRMNEVVCPNRRSQASVRHCVRKPRPIVL